MASTPPVPSQEHGVDSSESRSTTRILERAFNAEESSGFPSSSSGVAGDVHTMAVRV